MPGPKQNREAGAGGVNEIRSALPVPTSLSVVGTWSRALRHDVLSDLVRQDVQVVRDPLRVLRFLEMPRRARAELEARRQTLQPQHVFEREQRTGFDRLCHWHCCSVLTLM